MDTDRYIEHILETENLTDALDDNDASWLLDWGIGKLDIVLKDVTGPELADHRASDLMALMRQMNAIVGSYTQKDLAALAADLATLHNMFASLFPSTGVPLMQPDFQATAVCLSQLTTRQVLEFFATDFFPLA